MVRTDRRNHRPYTTAKLPQVWLCKYRFVSDGSTVSQTAHGTFGTVNEPIRIIHAVNATEKT